MSGRDLRKFVNFHRSAIGASDSALVTRLTEGHRSSHYKPVDYEKLQALTQIKKAAGNRTLRKIEKITQASKETKEQNLLQQHKACWSKEQIRLASLQKKYQSELDGLRPGSPFSYCAIKEFFKELEIYEELLSEEMKEFKKCTIDPIWDLREDLQFWIGENRERLILGEVEQEYSDVKEVVKSVKSQQHDVQWKLEQQQRRLEAELEDTSLMSIITPGPSTEVRVIKTGIPEEALTFECPDEEFRITVLEEFNMLDNKYEAYLEYLALKYSAAESSNLGNWTKEDHFHFMCILEQYHVDLPNHRALYIDRMLREIPHKTREELVEHEKWWFAHKFYQEQRMSSLRAWSSDREDMLFKVRVTFSDAMAAHEDEIGKENTRKKQMQICQELYQKVLMFREQKLEALKLQAAIAARREKENVKVMKAVQEKERQRRDKISDQIRSYEDQKERERQEAAEQEAARLEEIQNLLAEQAKVDQERVKYREEKLHEKEEAKQKAHQAALEEEQERERRLDRLREMVQVHVESDPDRVFKQTQASQARVASTYDEELELQKPLFTVYGYEDRKVSSDPRLKVEQALRNAGLHSTDYARRILSTIKPPQEPRKDQLSSVFKND